MSHPVIFVRLKPDAEAARIADTSIECLQELMRLCDQRENTIGAAVTVDELRQVVRRHFQHFGA